MNRNDSEKVNLFPPLQSVTIWKEKLSSFLKSTVCLIFLSIFCTINFTDFSWKLRNFSVKLFHVQFIHWCATNIQSILLFNRQLFSSLYRVDLDIRPIKILNESYRRQIITDKRVESIKNKFCFLLAQTDRDGTNSISRKMFIVTRKRTVSLTGFGRKRIDFWPTRHLKIIGERAARNTSSTDHRTQTTE